MYSECPQPVCCPMSHCTHTQCTPVDCVYTYRTLFLFLSACSFSLACHCLHHPPPFHSPLSLFHLLSPSSSSPLSSHVPSSPAPPLSHTCTCNWYVSTSLRVRVPARGHCKRKEVRGIFKFAEVEPWCDWQAQEGEDPHVGRWETKLTHKMKLRLRVGMYSILS